MSRLRQALNAYSLNPAVKAAVGAGTKAVAPSSVVTKGVTRPLTPAAPTKGVVRPLTPPPTVDSFGNPTVDASGNPLPFDASYENTVDAAIRDRDSTYATIDNAITATKQAYGFDDLSDPFSKIALLKQSFANSQRGTTNSMAAQGQLYSGAYGNAQNINQHNYDVNYDATRRAYDQTLGDLAARRTQAKNTALDTIAGAGQTRVETALQNRPAPSTVAPAKGAARPLTKPKAPAKGKGK